MMVKCCVVKCKNKTFTQGQTNPEENLDLDNTARKIEKQHLQDLSQHVRYVPFSSFFSPLS